MNLPAADIEAIIPAAGQGTRLGLGPKAFVALQGRTLLEHAITTALAVAARAIVAVPAADLARAQALVGGPSIRVIAGAARRTDTVRALVDAATAQWLLLHDIVHPFVTTELAQRVIAGARRDGAAAAALPNVDYLYGIDGMLRAAPGGVVAIQKPVVFRRADVLRGFATAERNAAGNAIPDVSVLEILALAGQHVTFIAGHPMNSKLTTPDDLALAVSLLGAADQRSR
jgi:2-C-methyl-D-erythritol 4-phosphate cytidylyltransferase